MLRMYNEVMVEVETKIKYPKVVEAYQKYEVTDGELIVGVDEAGRGSWAGPLVVGAVLIEKGAVDGVIDSKLMSPEKREELAPKIQQTATAWGLGWVAPEVIDEIGMQEATALAIGEALEEINAKYDKIIIDGCVDFLPASPNAFPKVGADGYIYQVSAAGIIAKVARDAFMSGLAPLYPKYNLEKNVGYGTPAHIAAINEYGVIPGLHRVKNVRPVREIYEQILTGKWVPQVEQEAEAA
jgi:ribonuclease HII